MRKSPIPSVHRRSSTPLLRRSRGFTLIEVIIAMAVASVAIFALMSFIQNSMNAQNSVVANAQIQDYLSLVEMQMLNTPTTCGTLLVAPGNTVNPQPWTPTNPTGGQTTVNLSFAGLPPLPSAVALNASATLMNLTAPVSPQTNWTGQLILTFVKGPSNSVGGSTIIRKIPLQLTTAPWTVGTAALPIVGCGPQVAQAITCSKLVSAAFVGANQYTFAFSTADCGGVLPDATYSGMVSTVNVCNGTKSFGIVNSGQSQYDAVTNTLVSGPAVWWWATNPCTWATGPNAGNQAEIGAVWVKK